MKIDIKAKRRGVKKAIKNARFATAVALTRTAQAGQKEVRDQLADRFTIRTTWVARGIRIRPARKVNLTAAVTVLDEFMLRQEEGGDKSPEKSSSVAIPFGARPTKKSVTRPSKFPGALLRRPNHFVKELSPGVRGLFRRLRGNRLRLMYLLVPSVYVPERFEFEETVREVAESEFSAQVRKALKNLD